jgi:hypothetical protein
MPQLNELESLFELKPASAFEVTTRDYRSYVKEFGIEFLVYDKNRFDSKLLNSRILELIYANDGYVICKIKTSSQ